MPKPVSILPRNDASLRIRLPAQLLADAKRVAAATSRSVNAEIRHRLRQAVAEHELTRHAAASHATGHDDSGAPAAGTGAPRTAEATAAHDAEA